MPTSYYNINTLTFDGKRCNRITDLSNNNYQINSVTVENSGVRTLCFYQSGFADTFTSSLIDYPYNTNVNASINAVSLKSESVRNEYGYIYETYRPCLGYYMRSKGLTNLLWCELNNNAEGLGWSSLFQLRVECYNYTAFNTGIELISKLPNAGSTSETKYIDSREYNCIDVFTFPWYNNNQKKTRIIVRALKLNGGQKPGILELFDQQFDISFDVINVVNMGYDSGINLDYWETQNPLGLNMCALLYTNTPSL